MTTISIVFDLPDSSPYYWPTLNAVGAAVDARTESVRLDLVGTDAIDDAFVASPGDGVVMGPGTPYLRPDRAEDLVRSAREQGIPLVGT